MKSTKKTLIIVLIGLLLGMVLIDVDHVYIYSANPIENTKCVLIGFLDLEDPTMLQCVKNKLHEPLLHDWRVGLFLFSFVISYYIVLKNEKKEEE